VQRADDAARLRQGRPVPVFCCWNGLLVANAAPFYEGVRVRRGVPGECAASECSLFCKDFWRKRARNFAVDPHVRVAYDLETYTAIHKAPWIEAGRPRAVRAAEEHVTSASAGPRMSLGATPTRGRFARSETKSPRSSSMITVLSRWRVRWAWIPTLVFGRPMPPPAAARAARSAQIGSFLLSS
jgi:hypothetical protein